MYGRNSFCEPIGAANCRRLLWWHPVTFWLYFVDNYLWKAFGGGGVVVILSCASDVYCVFVGGLKRRWNTLSPTMLFPRILESSGDRAAKVAGSGEFSWPPVLDVGVKAMSLIHPIIRDSKIDVSVLRWGAHFLTQSIRQCMMLTKRFPRILPPDPTVGGGHPLPHFPPSQPMLSDLWYFWRFAGTARRRSLVVTPAISCCKLSR